LHLRQIAGAIVRLNQSKKQHPILICDEAHLLHAPQPLQQHVRRRQVGDQQVCINIRALGSTSETEILAGPRISVVLARSRIVCSRQVSPV
jgi:hypothetical protein